MFKSQAQMCFQKGWKDISILVVILFVDVLYIAWPNLGGISFTVGKNMARGSVSMVHKHYVMGIRGPFLHPMLYITDKWTFTAYRNLSQPLVRPIHDVLYGIMIVIDTLC